MQYIRLARNTNLVIFKDKLNYIKELRVEISKKKRKIKEKKENTATKL